MAKEIIKIVTTKNLNGDMYLCDNGDEKDEVKCIPIVPTLNKVKKFCMQLAEKAKYDDENVLDLSFDDKSSYLIDDQEMKPFESFSYEFRINLYGTH